MKAIIIFSIIMTFIRACGGTDNSQQRSASSRDTLATVQDSTSPPSHVLTPSPMTTIKPNLTLVGAGIDSVVVLDSTMYRLYVFIGSAIEEPGMATVVELGQRLMLEPQFTYHSDGSFDPNDERNKRLLRLRVAKSPQSFIGKISLVPHQGWKLVDVDSF